MKFRSLSIVLFAITTILLTSCRLFDDFDITLHNVNLREGVTYSQHMKVFTSNDRFCFGSTVLAIPGIVHSAATWKPFADALLAQKHKRKRICSVVAVDMPGQGGSSLPDGMVYGDLTLTDYVTALSKSIDSLRDFGIRPKTIIGHSQGALVIQLLQQSLMKDGSSLHQSFNISNVVMLAPSIPAPVPWQFVDSGVAEQLAANFITADAIRGTHIVVPDEVWPGLFFTSKVGTANFF